MLAHFTRRTGAPIGWDMVSLGVFEIFYGMPWPDADREAYASFMRAQGYSFFIYGPKGDESLRKQWSRELSPQESARLKRMREVFHAQGVKFGVALSPQGLNRGLDFVLRRQLEEKVKALSDVGLDYLGLFFDDMMSAPDMAERQLDIVHLVEKVTSARVIFCPSYYCHDSLLDMLFGDRPQGYLEKIGRDLNRGIEVLWTGEQIISPEITRGHLDEVALTLRRKPFVCDNYYAADGPINCNYLRLVPPSGRKPDAFDGAAAWGMNPMNQAYLSQMALKSFAEHVLRGADAGEAFVSGIKENCLDSTADLIMTYHRRFAEEGLLVISEPEKSALIAALSSAPFAGPVEREIRQWLEGRYGVDIAALLDQSGFGE